MGYEPEVEYEPICQHLKFMGRILETEGYRVWGCSPVYDDNGRVHVYYSRWKEEYGGSGWLTACEVVHAEADRPEGPYTVMDVALEGRGGDAWDGWSIHNPSVYRIDGKYVLFYMGTNGANTGRTKLDYATLNDKSERIKLLATKRVGMAVADSPYGPWTRISDDKPLIDAGEEGEWDDLSTTNPAFVKTLDGKYRIYYKGINRREYEEFQANRRYGMAESDTLFGPYKKCDSNPVIDYSCYKYNVQSEDAYVWTQDGKYKIVMRDMGVFNHQYGLYVESDDGIKWTRPRIAYYGLGHYVDEKSDIPETQNRLERAQMLMKDGVPEYMFCAARGGKYNTSSPVVFKII